MRCIRITAESSASQEPVAWAKVVSQIWTGDIDSADFAVTVAVVTNPSACVGSEEVLDDHLLPLAKEE